MSLVYLAAAMAICLALHLGAMAIVARACGIAVRRVSYGIGPTVFSHGVFRVKVFPLSGLVQLKDSREEPLEPEDRANAYNHQSLWKQALVPLAGNATLLLVVIMILGHDGWSSFVGGFSQVFEGALSPLSTAQVYLRTFTSFSRDQSFLPIFGLVASKFAAVNLLPFPPFNGGQVLMALVRFGRPELRLEEVATRWGIVLTLILFLAWVVAAAEFILQNAS
jgi:membrane-associated protease RseP (regulator of RpoE activity)